MQKFKINKAKAVSVLVVFLVMVSPIYAVVVSPVYAGVPNEPHDADAMWVEPSIVNLTNGVPVGYKFNVTVWVNVTVVSASWEFSIAYNKIYFNATGCGYTAGTKSEFFENITTVPLIPTYESLNATHSWVLHAESYLMGAFRNPGYGSLAWVEFEVIDVPEEPQTFTFDICSSEDTFVQDPDENRITLTNCNNFIVIIPEFPGFPILAVLMILTLVAYVISTKLRSSKNIK